MSAEELTDISGIIVTKFIGDTSGLSKSGQEATSIVSRAAAQITTTLSSSAASASTLWRDAGDRLRDSMGRFAAELPANITQAFKTLGIESQRELQVAANNAQRAFDVISKSGTASAQDLERAQARVNAAFRATQTESQKLSQVYKSFDDSLAKVAATAGRVGQTMTVALSLPIALMAREVVQAGSSFESAFAGVRKTVQATEPELGIIRQSFRDMAKEIPVTANEFAKIGEAAGALGVKKTDIVSFSKTMADLGVTTNLTSDQAATGLARIANIMQNEAGPQFDRLGATLVALGNAGASTESEILELSLRLSGAGKAAGLSEADVLSFANALSSVGIEAEAGGSALSRVMTKIADSTKLGGNELKLFAAVAGQSAGDFKKSFQTDAAGAITTFIEGLGKMSASGKSLTPVLTALGLEDLRVRDALLRASGAGDLFRESLEVGSRAWRENTALTKEAAERYKTFDSQTQILKNRLSDIAITLFEQFRPALSGAVSALQSMTDTFAGLNPTAKTAFASLLLVAGASGPLVYACGKIVIGVRAVMDAMAATNFMAITSRANLIAWGSAALGAIAFATEARRAQRTIEEEDAKNPIIQANRQKFGFTPVAEATKRGSESMRAWIDSATATLKANAHRPTGETQRILDQMKDKHKPAGAAAGHALLDGYKEGLAGFEEAFGDVITKASSVNTYDKLSKAAQQGGKDYVAALKVVTAGINEFLQAQGFAAKLSNEEVDKMAKDGDTLLLAYGGSWKRTQEVIRQAGIEMATNLQQPLSAINDLLKENGINLSISEEFYSHLSDAQKAAVAVLDQYAASSKINKQNQNELNLSLAANTIEQNKAANAALFSNGALGLLKGTTASLIQTALGGKPVFDSYKTAQDAAFIIGSQSSVVAVTALQEKIKTLKDAIDKQDVSGIQSALKSVRDELQATADKTGASSASVNKSLDGVIGSFGTMGGKSKAAVSETVSSFQTLKERLAGILGDINVSINNNAAIIKARFELDLRSSVNSAIDTFQRLGEQLGLSGQQLENYVEQNVRKALENNTKITKEQLDLAIEAHKRASVQLPGIWQEVFGKVSSKVKGWASDIIGVIDLIPGAAGKAAQGVLRTVETWAAWASQILAILHRLNTSIPGSISDLAGKIVGIFKGVQGTAASVFHDIDGTIKSSVGGAASATGGAASAIGSSVTKMSSTMKTGLAAASGALASFTTAMSVAGATGSKTMGFLASLASSAAAGVMAGLQFGPIGGAVVGGISLLGGLFGLFGGKSPLQKAQEAAALQKAKDDIKLSQQAVLQAFEQTKQSILNTVAQARDILESIRFYESIGKEPLKAFFKDLSRFFSALVTESKKWVALASTDIKAASENLGAGVDLIGKLFPVLSGIGTYFKLGQGQIETFFSDVEPFFQRLGEFVSSIPKKIQKAIGKFGDRTESGISILSPLLEFIKGALDVKDVPDSAFDIVENTLTRMVERLGRIGENFKKSFLKMIGFVGENLSPGVTLLGSVLQVIKDAVGATAPSDADLDNIFSALLGMSTRMIAFANELTTEGLQKAAAIATAILPIASALKTWAEASAAIRGYTAIAADTWSNIADDFFKALDLLTILKGGVDIFETLSKYIADHITLAGDYLKNALTNFATAINTAASAINGALNLQSNLEGQGVNGGLGASSFGAQSLAPSFGTSSLMPSFAGSGAQAASGGGNITINLNVNGNLIHQAKLKEEFVGALVQLKKEGRF